MINRTILSLILLFGSLTSQAIPNEKPFVVPELKEWSPKEGYLILQEGARIAYNAKHPELLQSAQLFAKDYQTMFGRVLPITTQKAQFGDIELNLKPDSKLGAEGYSIRIDKRISISAPTPKGVYWGTQTLLQIAEQSPEKKFPQGSIRDYPDYPIRGFMIDCARKYIPLTYLQDLIRTLAYYKMNTLQIHLNDNGFVQYFEHDWSKTYSAFRLESDTYPGLTATDGHYTKQEFKQLQKDALALGVEIIPEIDIPAHSLSFAHYRPELGSKEYGMDHLDMFAPATYPFFDALFKEYLQGDDPVFIGKRVHIGTDEYSNAKQELIEKFRELTDRYIHQIESYGKQACIWGALTYAKGSTPVKSKNVVMSLWNNNFANPQQMIHDGYQLITMPDQLIYIVPGAPYYHDYLEQEKLYQEWNPLQLGNIHLKAPQPAVLGSLFALWNDHVGNGISVKDIHDRLFPALQTLSGKMWSSQTPILPYNQFDRKRDALSEAPGINQRGKLGDKPGVVFARETLSPSTSTGVTEIGYDYTVSFDLSGKKETKGTTLLNSENSTFYLSDPINGMLGFSRDGYLYTFRYKVQEGKSDKLQIEGNNISTTLKVNGKLIDRLNVQKRYFNAGKDSTKYYQTLFFPLKESGNYKSQITNFKVYNHIKQ